MRVRIVIDATIDDSLVADLEDGYGAAAALVSDSVRRDVGVNEYVDVETSRIDVVIGRPGESPVATATTYEHSRRATT